MENVITGLGSFAIGTRLRRLHESLWSDMTLIYKEHGLPLEAKDFILYYLLSTRSSMSISDVARELNLTHPAIIHIAKSLEKMGYVDSEKSPTDSRKRMLKLTAKGQEHLVHYKVLWGDIAGLNRELFEEQVQLLEQIEKLEALLKEKNYYQRYHSIQLAKAAEK